MGGWNDKFGWSAAIDGDYAIVGVIGDDDHAPGIEAGEGAAYIYHRENGTWIEQAKLLPQFRSSLAGWCVDIEGDLAAVGTTELTAFIFRRDGTTC